MSSFEIAENYSTKLHEKKLMKQLEDKAIAQIKARINRDIRKIIETEEVITNR